MSLTRHLRRLFRRSGGTMPERPPLHPGEGPVILSPGWVELPPGADERYAEDFLAALNQPRRK
jgi:hypothetical protein